MVVQGREWLATILSRFGPIRDRSATVTTLDFEKPLLELDKRIKEVWANCLALQALEDRGGAESQPAACG
jgi:hypothetical protein